LYNLLVKFSPWTDGRDTIPRHRTFEHTDQPLNDRFQPGGQLDFASLLALPTFFVQETSGQRDQMARVGTIRQARINGHDIVLDYNYEADIAAIPNVALQARAADFGIHKDFEFYRTHWAVKEEDLFPCSSKKRAASAQATNSLSIG
jgi:hypothetical protein